jgi:simple sugar transport system substrate-binding protein
MQAQEPGGTLASPSRRQLAALLGSGLAGLGTLGMAGCSRSAETVTKATNTAARLRIAMITHGDDGLFWSVVKRGATDAAGLTGVVLDYQGAGGDADAQARLISEAIADDPDGIAVTAPDPQTIAPALEQARSKGIAAITLNSGLDSYAQLGAFTHVGQDEQIAGRAAGQRLALDGAKRMLCVVHQKNNAGLELRATGARVGFGAGYQRLDVTGVADWTATTREVQARLRADPSIDAVLTLGSDICEVVRKVLVEMKSPAKLASFDLSAEVISALRDKTMDFAVDQQQYMQGYLPVLFLYLYKVNAATVGGGQPVLTGPSFADVSNAVTIERLIALGTR